MTFPVKVAAYIYPPYINPCFLNYTLFSKSCPDPGSDIALLYNQLLALDFRPEFVLAENITDMFDMLERSEADIAGSATLFNMKISNALDITHPSAMDKYAFIVHKSKETNSLPNLLLAGCHWSVWLLFLITLMFLTSSNKIYKQHLRKRLFSDNNYKMHSHKTPLLAWSFCFGIFLSVYSQYLAVALIKPIEIVKPFKNLDTLGEKIFKSGCRLVLFEFDLENLFNITGNNLDYYPFSDKVQQFFQEVQAKHLFTAVADDNSFAQKVQTDKCTYGVMWDSYFPLFNGRYDGFFNIELNEMPQSMFAYVYRKGFLCAQRLRFINAGPAFDVASAHINKVIEDSRHYSNYSTNSLSKLPLRMSQLKDVFIMLTVGLTTAICVYGIQYIDVVVSRRKKCFQAV